jgi:UDP-N-acetylmuramyl pentapeptide phosphotransferase/UDP-N-acetylglucosamine-1-phosphate transferase
MSIDDQLSALEQNLNVSLPSSTSSTVTSSGSKPVKTWQKMIFPFIVSSGLIAVFRPIWLYKTTVDPKSGKTTQQMKIPQTAGTVIVLTILFYLVWNFYLNKRFI